MTAVGWMLHQKQLQARSYNVFSDRSFSLAESKYFQWLLSYSSSQMYLHIMFQLFQES